MFKYPAKGIWSNHYADNWKEGYVIGNGELGGILYGKPVDFSVVINHHSCYLKGNPMDKIPDLSDKLPELRKIIKTEGYQKGIEYFEREALHKGYPGLTMSDVYHPAGRMAFTFPSIPNQEISDYTRQLDYEKGLIQECFSINENQSVIKESFVSRDENCLYLSIQSEDSFDINFSLTDFKNEALVQKIVDQTNTFMVQESTYIEGSSYTLPVKWDIQEGKVHVENNQVVIKETKQLTLAVGFNRQAEDLNLEEYEKIKSRHVEKHSNQFNSVSLDLVSPSEREQSFEAMIDQLTADKEVPLVLYEKMYDASRYVIQSMSGKTLPNLQGIWSGDFHPAWSGDFTFDTNVQLAIASYASLGNFEGFDGLFDQLTSYLEDFKENAKNYYGCRGYLVPVHASTRALHVHWNSEWPLIFWTAGAGWLAHFYHEYYDYTLDKEFLRHTAVPFYIETLLFYEDFYSIENNEIVLRPSYSAENGMGDTSTMDVAVIKETIHNLTSALNILGESLPEKYTEMLSQLPEYLIDSEGVLKEWIDEQTVENHNHRHFSNLYPVFQSKEITKADSALWKAAHTALDKRLEAWLLSEDGDTSSSHGRMHAAMCAIALERPEDVEAALDQLVSNQSFLPSLVTSHYNQGEVFNVDANGSLPKVMHDSLIYVEKPGELTLFKATPDWLKKGTIKGMRLLSGVTVQQMKWDLAEGYCEISLISTIASELTIRIQESYQFESMNKNDFVTVALNENQPTKLDLRFNSTGADSYD